MCLRNADGTGCPQHWFNATNLVDIDGFALSGWTIHEIDSYCPKCNDGSMTRGSDFRITAPGGARCDTNTLKLAVCAAGRSDVDNDVVTPTIQPGQTLQYFAFVDAGQSSATFATAWPGSDVQLSLTSPAGRVINRSIVSSDVAHQLSPTAESYTINSPESGMWTVSLYGADVRAGGEPVTFTIRSKPAPPRTAATLSPPTGSGGWSNSAVTVNFSASASPGADGVQGITYSLSGAQPDAGSISGASGSVNVTAQGQTTVSFFATDNAGSTEPTQTLTIKIDATLPTTTATPSPGPTNGWSNGTIAVTLAASDGPNGPGVAKTEYNLDGAGWSPYSSPVSIGSDGSHTLLYHSTDVAGNQEADKSLAVKIDSTPPSCDLTAVIAGPPKQLQITVLDTGSGLQSVAATTLDNATLDGGTPAGWTAGTTGPVVFTATKTNQALGARVALLVTDVAGNQTACDPVSVTLKGDGKQAESVSFKDIAQEENQVTITNGTPGLTQVRIAVNGKEFGVELENGEKRMVDISRALQAGDTNSITLTYRGPTGSTADVLIWGGTRGSSPRTHRTPVAEHKGREEQRGSQQGQSGNQGGRGGQQEQGGAGQQHGQGGRQGQGPNQVR